MTRPISVMPSEMYRQRRKVERRYSPAEVVSTEVVPVIGRPDPARIGTSHVECQNFSKKWENHWAALTLYFAFYNFGRILASVCGKSLNF
jgi:hypothetical protein